MKLNMWGAMKYLSIGICCLVGFPAFADVLEVQTVTDGIWALVGPATQRDPENLANNATFGVIETADGVVLVDPGGSWKGAEMIHDAIKGITDKPVRYVINSGGQDHRWLGNGYWKAQGAQVIASADAVADHEARGSIQMTGLSVLIGEGLAGTEPATADITFDDAYVLEFGGVTFDIRHPGAAHTPGDSYVWIENASTVFTGDIVYVGRVLGVSDVSSSVEWVETFSDFAALSPEHVVPGHGPATTLAVATADTYDYLVNLRAKMAEYIDDGGDIIGSVDVDQSAFSYLEQFDALAKRNAQAVFQQMEWE